MFDVCVDRCMMFVYTEVCFVSCFCLDCCCGLSWERIYNIWEEFWNMHLLTMQFDCPEVTLCSCWAVKIQLPTAVWLKRGMDSMDDLVRNMWKYVIFSHGFSNSFYIKYAHVCQWILIGGGSNCEILHIYWISPTPNSCLLQICSYYVQLLSRSLCGCCGLSVVTLQSLWFSGIVRCGSFAPTVSVGVSLVKKEMSSKVLWKNQIQTSLCPGKEGRSIW